MTFLPSSGLRRYLFVCSALVTIALLSGISHAAPAARLVDMRWDTKRDHTRFVAEFSGKVTWQAFDKQSTEKYYYVDIKGAQTAGVKKQNIRMDDQRLLAILIRPFPDQKILRFVFNTDGRHRVVTQEMSDPYRLVIDVLDRSSPAGARPVSTASRAVPVARSTVSGSKDQGGILARLVNPWSSTKKGKRPYVVVIDPGHGGTSIGAVGKDRKGKTHREKDYALAISRELARLVDADPSMKAVILRTGDQSISLEERVAMTEATRGDVFVSVHLNAVPGDAAKTATGIEVFYLSEKGKNRLIDRMIEQSSTAVRSKASASTIKRHIKAKAQRLTDRGGLLAREIEKAWGSISYYKTRSRGVKRANFWVLKNSYMPGVLVEVCFISNKNDLEFIRQTKNQKAVANMIYNGLRSYRNKVGQ